MTENRRTIPIPIGGGIDRSPHDFLLQPPSATELENLHTLEKGAYSKRAASVTISGGPTGSGATIGAAAGAVVALSEGGGSYVPAPFTTAIALAEAPPPAAVASYPCLQTPGVLSCPSAAASVDGRWIGVIATEAAETNTNYNTAVFMLLDAPTRRVLSTTRFTELAYWPRIEPFGPSGFLLLGCPIPPLVASGIGAIYQPTLYARYANCYSGTASFSAATPVPVDSNAVDTWQGDTTFNVGGMSTDTPPFGTQVVAYDSCTATRVLLGTPSFNSGEVWVAGRAGVDFSLHVSHVYLASATAVGGGTLTVKVQAIDGAAATSGDNSGDMAVHADVTSSTLLIYDGATATYSGAGRVYYSNLDLTTAASGSWPYTSTNVTPPGLYDGPYPFYRGPSGLFFGRQPVTINGSSGSLAPTVGVTTIAVGTPFDRKPLVSGSHAYYFAHHNRLQRTVSGNGVAPGFAPTHGHAHHKNAGHSPAYRLASLVYGGGYVCRLTANASLGRDEPTMVAPLGSGIGDILKPAVFQAAGGPTYSDPKGVFLGAALVSGVLLVPTVISAGGWLPAGNNPYTNNSFTGQLPEDASSILNNNTEVGWLTPDPERHEYREGSSTGCSDHVQLVLMEINPQGAQLSAATFGTEALLGVGSLSVFDGTSAVPAYIPAPALQWDGRRIPFTDASDPLNDNLFVAPNETVGYDYTFTSASETLYAEGGLSQLDAGSGDGSLRAKLAFQLVLTATTRSGLVIRSAPIQIGQIDPFLAAAGDVWRIAAVTWCEPEIRSLLRAAAKITADVYFSYKPGDSIDPAFDAYYFLGSTTPELTGSNGLFFNARGLSGLLHDNTTLLFPNPAPLYTDSGELEPTRPPATNNIAHAGGRIFLLPSDDPRTIWSSKVVEPRRCPEFNPLLSFRAPPDAGSVRALVGFQDRLLILAENGVWEMPTHTGPDVTGSGAFPEPSRVAGAPGCVTAKGVASGTFGTSYVSAAGLVVLRSDGSLLPAGRTLGLDFSAPGLLASAYDQTSEQLFLYTSSGSFVYDVANDAWSTGSEAATGAAAVSGGIVALTGSVLSLRPTTTVSGGGGRAAIYTTAWLAPNGPLHLHRFHEITALLNFRVVPVSTDTLTVKIRYDYSNTVVDTFVITGAQLATGPILRIQPTRQKATAMQVTFQETGLLAMDWQLCALSLEVGVKETHTRPPART